MSAEEPVDPLPVGRGMIAGKPPAQAGGSSLMTFVNRGTGGAAGDL